MLSSVASLGSDHTAPRQPINRWPAVAFLFVSAAVTVWHVAFLYQGWLNLFFDEAQYWFWSTEPAFGYFSKPPMVAWIIYLTTSLLGDSEFAIKVGSPLVHCATSWLIFALTRDLYGPKEAFWAGLGYLSLPAVAFSSAIVSTDPPLLLFWAASLVCLHRALTGGQWIWWVGLGVAIGLGMLSKYAMLFFLMGLVVHGLWSGSLTKLLHRRFALSVLIAGLIYLPNVLWNLDHGLVSYVHTGDNARLDRAGLRPGEFLAFVASQALVFGPVFFGALVAILLRLFRSRSVSERTGFLLSFSLPPLIFYSVLSLVSGANANWAVTAYVSAVPLVTATLYRHRKWWLYGALVLHAALAVALHEIPKSPQPFGFELSARSDPLRRIRGWDEMGAQVVALWKLYPEAKVLVTDRPSAAEFLYYARPAPVVKWNADGDIDDHFDLVRGLRDEDTGRYLLVTDKSQPTDILARFERIISLGTLSAPRCCGDSMTYHAFLLSAFRGYGTATDEQPTGRSH
ncbi:MAG: glycosyltransferase family 39 protein [Pseudomonadota bacterium]|nr:glycosyltransferase family 39 protein [Pseudomonadota bacterium]